MEYSIQNLDCNHQYPSQWPLLISMLPYSQSDHHPLQLGHRWRGNGKIILHPSHPTQSSCQWIYLASASQLKLWQNSRLTNPHLQSWWLDCACTPRDPFATPYITVLKSKLKSTTQMKSWVQNFHIWSHHLIDLLCYLCAIRQRLAQTRLRSTESLFSLARCPNSLSRLSIAQSTSLSVEVARGASGCVLCTLLRR